MPNQAFRVEAFPFQSKLLLLQFDAVSSHPIPFFLGEETRNQDITTTSFQVAVDSDKVSLSLLFSKPPILAYLAGIKVQKLLEP